MICNSFANKLLNYLFGGVKYVGILSEDPTSSGSMLNEFAGEGYVRKPFSFTYASGRSVANSETIWWSDLPDLPPRYLGVWDSLEGGLMIGYVATNVTTSVPEGQRFVVSEGDLAFTFN